MLSARAIEFGGVTAFNALLLAAFLVGGHDVAGLGATQTVVLAHGLTALVSFPVCRLVVWRVPRGRNGAEVRRAGVFFAGAVAAAAASILATHVIDARGSFGLVVLNYAAVGVVSILKFGVQRGAMVSVEPA
jgi:hypothetical protein